MIALAHDYERELSLLLGANGLKQLEAGLAAIEAKLPPVSGRRGPQD